MSAATKPVIGVVGAGTMGRGIAQVFVQAGHRVLFHDTAAPALEAACTFIGDMLTRAVAKDRMTQAEADAAIARLEPVDSLDGFVPCDVVIEAIVEALEPKQALFTKLADILRNDAILATNTSSLAATRIAAPVPGPERVIGLHFFNPVPLMKLVEVIPGLRTRPDLVAEMTTLIDGIGHTPVTATDSPGFLVNHAGRGLYTEGLRLLQEGVATPHQIDDVMREAAGFRMGPFELLDLTGLDVSFPVMQSIYEQFWQEPRFRPSPTPPLRVAAGLLGRKTGEGFYRYDAGKIIRPAPVEVPDIALPPIYVAPGDGAAELTQTLLDAGVTPCDSPAPEVLLLVSPLGRDATSMALDLDLDPTRTVAIDPLFGLAGRRTVMTTPVTRPEMRDAAFAALARGGKGVTVIHDSPGFVAQRMVATITNIACEIAQARIATPEDIDRATMLGLGYRIGPLALGDQLGPARIMTILTALQEATGDPRYRPSLWLKRRAALGVSLLTPEG